jgi:hypothetical protein
VVRGRNKPVTSETDRLGKLEARRRHPKPTGTKETKRDTASVFERAVEFGMGSVVRGGTRLCRARSPLLPVIQ